MTHSCPTPVEIGVVSDGGTTTVVVPPLEPTEVWAHCCEPGLDGEVEIQANAFEDTISFADMRRQSVLDLPPEACSRG